MIRKAWEPGFVAGVVLLFAVHLPSATLAQAGHVAARPGEGAVGAFAFGRVIEGVLSRIKIIHKKREANGKERPFNPAIDMSALDKSRDKILAVLRDAESDMTPTQVAHEAEMSFPTARQALRRM
jgi:hypothetical protein